MSAQFSPVMSGNISEDELSVLAEPCYDLGPFLPRCADASSLLYTAAICVLHTQWPYFACCVRKELVHMYEHPHCTQTCPSNCAAQGKCAWAQNSLLVLVHPETTHQPAIPFVCTPRRYEPNVNILPPTQFTADGGRFCWKRKDTNLFRAVFCLFPFGWES